MSLALGLGLAGLVGLAGWQYDRALQAEYRAQTRSEVASRLSALRLRLGSLLQEHLQAAEILTTVYRLQAGGAAAGFESRVARLVRSRPAVVGVSLIVQGRLAHHYPSAREPGAPATPAVAWQRPDESYRLAAATGRPVISGPLDRSGGESLLVSRQAVWADRPLDGWIELRLDFDRLLALSGLVGHRALRVAIRGRDALGAQGETIFGPPGLFEGDPVRQEIVLPNGHWQIAASPLAGWTRDRPGRSAWLAGTGLLAALVAVLVYLLGARPQQLREAVAGATAELRDGRARYRLLFNQTPHAVMVFDAATLRPLEFNDKACEVLGYSRERLAGCIATDWDAGLGRLSLPARLEQLRPDGEDEYETRFRTAAGQLIEVWISIRPIVVDGRQAVHTVFRDISRRKRNEEQLRKLSVAVEQSPSMVMITDPDGHIEYVNPKFAQVCGYAPRELVGARPSMLKSGRTELQRYHELWRTIRQGREWRGEMLNRRKDGSLYWVSSSISALIDDAGEVTHYVAVQEDITEQKRASEAVHSQLRFQQSLIDALPTPIFYKDVHGVYLGCNRAFSELVGVPQGKVVGRSGYAFADEARASVFEQADVTLLRECKAQTYEAALVLDDGQRRQLVINKAPFHGGDGQIAGLIGTVLDITGHKHHEAMLRQVAEGVSGEVGQAFLESLVQYVSGALGVDTVFVAELDPRLPSQLNSLAVVVDGQVVDNFSHPLTRTPCATVVAQGAVVIRHDVCARYPRDQRLRALGIQGFAGYPLRDAHGRTLGVLAVMHRAALDIADAALPLMQILATRAAAELQRRRAEEDLRMAATVFETTSEAIMVTDSDNLIKAVNPAFSRITGYREDEVIGREPSLLSSGRHDVAFYEDLWRELAQSGHWEGEIWNRRKNGEIYPEWLSISAIGAGDESGGDYVAVFTDITKRKQDEEKIWRQANFDALTGLPNRFLFMDRLLRALTQAETAGEKVAVLLIDLDRLKWINDMLGHASGDRLLQHVSQRLLSCVHGGDTVSRWAGDEFSMIVTGIESDSQAEQAIESVQRALSRPFSVDNQEAFVTASIGLAVYPLDGLEPESLISNATAAMTQVKSNGGNGFRRYSDDINRRAAERISLERDLHWAVERGELMVHYQPILDLGESRVVGAESLVRWQHPKRGLVSPEVFIPLAEETGLITEIGEWVLAEVCRQAVAWRDSGLGPIHFAVNVSRYQFMRKNFDQRVLEIINRFDVDPALLVLEVTESTMAEDETALIEVMQKLRAFGLRWSLDDFGTGYSSLSNLKNIPVDLLKIDKSFISDVTTNTDDAAVAKAIVVMAKTLGLQVVAEGIASRKQLAFLRGLGCEYGQGYLFSIPLAADAFRRFARTRIGSQKPRLVSD